MSVELLYTSAPQGLKKGSRGFCTVLSTAGMPVNLALRLEALSGYRQVYELQDERSRQNPVCFSHVKVAVAGRPVSVLSRIAAYGVDYSQRTNKIAHHVVPKEGEFAEGGPALLLSDSRIFRDAWNGNCETPAQGPSIAPRDQPPSTCRTWERVAGDGGWAGVVAEHWLEGISKPMWIIFSDSQQSECLSLMNEAIAILPRTKRWQATFSTYYTSLPPDVDCRVRCILAGSEEARLAKARGTVIDLTSVLGAPPETPATLAASQGACIVADTWSSTFDDDIDIDAALPTSLSDESPPELRKDSSQDLQLEPGMDLDEEWVLEDPNEPNVPPPPPRPRSKSAGKLTKEAHASQRGAESAPREQGGKLRGSFDSQPLPLPSHESNSGKTFFILSLCMLIGTMIFAGIAITMFLFPKGSEVTHNNDDAMIAQREAEEAAQAKKDAEIEAEKQRLKEANDLKVREDRRKQEEEERKQREEEAERKRNEKKAREEEDERKREEAERMARETKEKENSKPAVESPTETPLVFRGRINHAKLLKGVYQIDAICSVDATFLEVKNYWCFERKNGSRTEPMKIANPISNVLEGGPTTDRPKMILTQRKSEVHLDLEFSPDATFRGAKLAKEYDKSVEDALTPIRKLRDRTRKKMDAYLSEIANSHQDVRAFVAVIDPTAITKALSDLEAQIEKYEGGPTDSLTVAMKVLVDLKEAYVKLQELSVKHNLKIPNGFMTPDELGQFEKRIEAFLSIMNEIKKLPPYEIEESLWSRPTTIEDDGLGRLTPKNFLVKNRIVIELVEEAPKPPQEKPEPSNTKSKSRAKPTGSPSSSNAEQK